MLNHWQTIQFNFLLANLKLGKKNVFPIRSSCAEYFCFTEYLNVMEMEEMEEFNSWFVFDVAWE